MKPLSATLVSVLETASREGVTHVEILRDPRSARWFRGKELVANAPLTDVAFATLVDELRALAGGAPQIEVSPSLTFCVEIDGDGIRMIFSAGDLPTAAEHAFAELMSKLHEVRAESVICAAGSARFLRGEREIERLPLVEGAILMLVEHGTKLASLGGGREGRAVLFGPRGPSTLRVQLVEDGIAFAVAE